MDVEVYKVEAWQNKMCPDGAIRLHWDGDCGWGYYDLIIETENGESKISGYSERMDTKDDKSFLKCLLEPLLERVVVED